MAELLLCEGFSSQPERDTWLPRGFCCGTLFLKLEALSRTILSGSKPGRNFPFPSSVAAINGPVLRMISCGWNVCHQTVTMGDLEKSENNQPSHWIFFFFFNKSLFKHLCPDLCASQFLICKQQNHKTSLFWSKLLWDLLPLPGSLKLTTTFWHCRVKGDLEDVLEQAIAWDALCEINTRIPLGLLFAFQISHSYHTLRRNSGSLKLRVFTNVREAWKGFTKLPPTRKRECQIISGNWHRALAPQSMLEFFLPHSYSSEQCLCASWHKTTYCVMNF